MKNGVVNPGVKWWPLAAWGAVSLAGTMMMVPLNAIIPAFYAKNTAVSLETIGTILFAARLFDAFLDPAVGYFSDRTKGPLGRRKPWILAGGFVACLASYFLFSPPPDATGWYFLPVMLAFYSAYSMMIVPHSAWGSELSRSYAERSLISGVLTFAGVLGLLIFMGLPILLSSPILPIFPTAEITPAMLTVLAWLLVILIPLCAIMPSILTPKGVATEDLQPRLSVALRSMSANGPFRSFLLAYAFTGLAYGVYYATTYMFIDSYLGMADKFPLVYAVAAMAQIASIPVWTRLCARYERSRIWALGLLAFGVLLPTRFFIPEGEWAFPVLLAITVVLSFANAASQVPQMAVLADCIDFGTMKTRTNLAGSYNAIKEFTLKASLAAGGGIAFFLLAALDFDAKTASHSKDSLESLAAVHTFLPLLLFSLAGIFFWRFPLNRSRQGIIRKRLESRAALAPAT